MTTAETAAPSDPTMGGSYLRLRLLQFGLLFLSGLIVTRSLGPGGRGQYALALNFAATIWVISHLTLEGAAGRSLGRREATLAELCGFLSLAVITISMITVPLAIAAGMAAESSLLGGASSTAIVLAALTIPFLLITQVAGYLLMATGQIRHYGVITAATSLTQLTVVVAVVIGGSLAPSSAIGIVLGGLALSSVAMLTALIRRVGVRSLKPRTTRALALRVLRNGLALHPLSITFQLAAQVDLFLVGGLISTRDAGLYSLALTLADAAFLAAAVVAQGALHMQTSFEESAAVRGTIGFARQCLQIAVLSAFVASALAYPGIVLIYGRAWSASVVPFIVLSTAGVAIAFESPMRTLVARIGRPVSLALLAFVMMGANVAVTVALIPSLGMAGAALGTVFAYWLFAAGLILLLRRAAPYADVRELFRPPRRDDALISAALQLSRRFSGIRRTAGSA